MSSDVDIGCFLSQYRDDVQPLMMTFDQMHTWSMVFLATTIILFLVFFVFGCVNASSHVIKLLYTLILIVGSVWLIAISWHLKSQVGAVIDGVKHAVSTVDCQSEHIGAVYHNDDSTHAETYYMGAFIVNIAAVVFGLGTYWLAGEKAEGIDYDSLDGGGCCNMR